MKTVINFPGEKTQQWGVLQQWMVSPPQVDTAGMGIGRRGR